MISRLCCPLLGSGRVNYTIVNHIETETALITEVVTGKIKVAQYTMKYNPDMHNRRSTRLKGFDYSQAGLYFVTICTQNRFRLFGNIKNDEMIFNDAGRMIETQWLDLMQQFTGIDSSERIVMPNHFHGIIKLPVGVPLVGTQNMKNIQINTQPESGQPQGIAPTVGDIIGAFKSITTNEYIRGVKHHNWQRFDKKLWQRNYYEHIIRNEKSYRHISEYIQNNPSKWLNDTYYEEYHHRKHL